MSNTRQSVLSDPRSHGQGRAPEPGMPESILRGYCSPTHSLHSRPGGLLAPVTPHLSVITFFPPSYPTLPTYPCSPTTCHCQLALLRSAPVRYTVPVAPLGRHPPSRHHRPRALIGRRSSPTRAANGAPCRCRRTPCQGMPLPNAVLQIAVEVPHCHPPDVAAGAAASLPRGQGRGHGKC